MSQDKNKKQAPVAIKNKYTQFQLEAKHLLGKAFDVDAKTKDGRVFKLELQKMGIAEQLTWTQNLNYLSAYEGKNSLYGTFSIKQSDKKDYQVEQGPWTEEVSEKTGSVYKKGTKTLISGNELIAKLLELGFKKYLRNGKLSDIAAKTKVRTEIAKAKNAALKK